MRITTVALAPITCSLLANVGVSASDAGASDSFRRYQTSERAQDDRQAPPTRSPNVVEPQRTGRGWTESGLPVRNNSPYPELPVPTILSEESWLRFGHLAGLSTDDPKVRESLAALRRRFRDAERSKRAALFGEDLRRIEELVDQRGQTFAPLNLEAGDFAARCLRELPAMLAREGSSLRSAFIEANARAAAPVQLDDARVARVIAMCSRIALRRAVVDGAWPEVPRFLAVDLEAMDALTSDVEAWADPAVATQLAEYARAADSGLRAIVDAAEPFSRVRNVPDLAVRGPAAKRVASLALRLWQLETRAADELTTPVPALASSVRVARRSAAFPAGGAFFVVRERLRSVEPGTPEMNLVVERLRAVVANAVVQLDQACEERFRLFMRRGEEGARASQEADWFQGRVRMIRRDLDAFLAAGFAPDFVMALNASDRGAVQEKQLKFALEPIGTLSAGGEWTPGDLGTGWPADLDDFAYRRATPLDQLPGGGIRMQAPE